MEDEAQSGKFDSLRCSVSNKPFEYVSENEQSEINQQKKIIESFKSPVKKRTLTMIPKTEPK